MMGEHKIPKEVDPIGAAIESTEEAERAAEVERQRAEFPDHFRIDFKFDTGHKARLFVPNTLNADQFETLVGLLMQARVMADQKREAAKTLVTPDKPSLVSVDGRRLT